MLQILQSWISEDLHLFGVACLEAGVHFALAASTFRNRGVCGPEPGCTAAHCRTNPQRRLEPQVADIDAHRGLDAAELLDAIDHEAYKDVAGTHGERHDAAGVLCEGRLVAYIIADHTCRPDLVLHDPPL